MTTSVNPVQIASKATKGLTYDDTITPSSNMEATGGSAGNDNDLDDTVNNLISVLQNLKGSTNWYDDFDDGTFSTRTLATVGTDLNTVETKDFLFNRLVLVDLGTLTANIRILTAPTETPSVDASVTAGVEGAIAANDGGTGSDFGATRTAGAAVLTADLVTTGQPNALRPLNLGAVFNATTGDPVVTSNGNQMKCLLLYEGSSDGAFGNTSGIGTGNRGAIVFVEINATNDGYIYGDSTDLPAGINYTYTERSEFLNLNEWAFLNEPSADAVAGTDVTLTLAATNQSGVVSGYGAKDIDWEIPDSQHFQFQDDGGSNILIMAVDGSGNRTVTVGVNASNDVTTIEGATLDINVTNDVTIAGGLVIEDGGNPDIEIGVVASTIAVSTGTLSVTGASGLDLDAGATGPVTIDSTAGAVSVDGVTSSNFTVTANAAGNQTLTLSATNAGAGTGIVAVSADGVVTVDSTGAGVSIDAVEASNFTVTSGTGESLTLSTVTSGDVIITAASVVDINSGAGVDIDATTTVDINAGTAADASANNITITGGVSTGATNAAPNVSIVGGTPGAGGTAVPVAISTPASANVDAEDAVLTILNSGTGTGGGHGFRIFSMDQAADPTHSAPSGSLAVVVNAATTPELWLNDTTGTGNGTDWVRMATLDDIQASDTLSEVIANQGGTAFTAGAFNTSWGITDGQNVEFGDSSNVGILTIAAAAAGDSVTVDLAATSAGATFTVTDGTNDLMVVTASTGGDTVAFSNFESLLSSTNTSASGHERWDSRYHYFGEEASNPNYVTLNAQNIGTSVRGGTVVVTDANTYTPGNTISASTSTTFTVDVGAPGIAAGDFLLVTGASVEVVNGLYQIATAVSGTLTIDTTPDEEFCKTSIGFTGSVTATGFHATVCVMRCSTTGSWEVADGDSGPLTYTELGTTAGSTLQAAYVAGSDIVVSAANTSVNITGTPDDVTVPLVLSGGAHTASTAGEVLSVINDPQATGNLVQLTNAGSGVGLDVLQSAGTGDLLVARTASQTLFEVDGAGQVLITPLAAQDTTITMLTTGSLDVDVATGDVTFNASGAGGTFLVDGFETGDISVDSATSTAATLALSANNTSSGNGVLTLHATATGAGTGTVAITSEDFIDISADAVATTVNFATGAAAKTVNMVTGTSASSVTMGTNAAHTITVGDTGNTGAVQINSASSIGLDYAGMVTWDLDANGTTATTDILITFPTKYTIEGSDLDRNAATAPSVVRQESTFTAFENGTEGNLTTYFGTGYTTNTGTNTYQVSVVQGSTTTDTATAITNNGAATNPTVTTTGSGTFSTGDYVMFTSGVTDANRGHIYEVVSHVTNTLTLAASPSVGSEWCANQVATESTITGTITAVTVSVFRVATDGTYSVAEAASDAGTITYQDITTTSSTLASAVANVGSASALQDISFTWQVSDTENLTFQSETGTHTLISMAPTAGGDVVTVGDTGDTASAFNVNTGSNTFNAGARFDADSGTNTIIVGVDATSGTANTIDFAGPSGNVIASAGNMTVESTFDGGELNLYTANSATTSGAVYMESGTGGTGASGLLNIGSGASSATSGLVAIYSGVADGSGETSGVVSVVTGNGTTGAQSGDLYLRTGNGNLSTGDAPVNGAIEITTGSNSDDAATGAITLATGNNSSTGVSGNIVAMTGTAAGANTGSVSVTTANPAAGFTSGAITVATGSGGPFTDGSSGLVSVNSGAARGTGESSGDVELRFGSGTSGAGVGNLTIGVASGEGTTGDFAGGVGNIQIQSSSNSSTATSGNVDISTGGNSSATTGSVGLLSLTGGNRTVAAGAGGAVSATGGVGFSTGAGGAFTATGGLGGATGSGGTASLIGGQGGATGAGANALVTGGAGGATSGNAGGVTVSAGAVTDGNGGSITISATSGVGSTRDGGIVQITSGANTTGGTPGYVSVGTAATAAVTQGSVVLTLDNNGSGTGGGQDMSVYTGTAAPTHTANSGSLFLLDDGSTGALYINESSTGSGTTWSPVLTGSSGSVTRAYFADTFNTTITSGTTITTSELTNGVLPSKPSSNFTFARDAEFFLNGIRLVAGAAGAPTDDVEDAAGDTFVLNQNASSGDQLIVVYYTGSTAA